MTNLDNFWRNKPKQTGRKFRSILKEGQYFKEIPFTIFEPLKILYQYF
jgi:hypothetical protein